MRCLHCNHDPVPSAAEVCPRCGVHMQSMLRDMLPAGTHLHDGKYRIDYALGRGGFGITYRAVHLQLEQLAAVKEFYPQEQALRDTATGRLSVKSSQRDSYERALRRFVREGRVLARLDHPSVVRVRDLFEERGTAYLVMDLVAGKSLREVLDEAPDRRLPEERVRNIVGQLVGALEEVHREGVYHLDIKPDNVLLTPKGRAVLIDFGAARQNIPSKTTQAFTPEYAAPEVMAGTEVGPESDIFELGMMSHEMLTGKLPTSAMRRWVKDDWTPDGLEEPWRALVSSALHMRAEERPHDVHDWWDAAQRQPKASRPKPAPGLSSEDESERAAHASNQERLKREEEVRAKLARAESELRGILRDASPARDAPPAVVDYKTKAREALDMLKREITAAKGLALRDMRPDEAECERLERLLERRHYDADSILLMAEEQRERLSRLTAHALRQKIADYRKQLELGGAERSQRWTPRWFVYLLLWLILPVPLAALTVNVIRGSFVRHMNEELWTFLIAVLLLPLVFIPPLVVNVRRRSSDRVKAKRGELSIKYKIVELENYLNRLTKSDVV